MHPSGKPEGLSLSDLKSHAEPAAYLTALARGPAGDRVRGGTRVAFEGGVVEVDRRADRSRRQPTRPMVTFLPWGKLGTRAWRRRVGWAQVLISHNNG